MLCMHFVRGAWATRRDFLLWWVISVLAPFNAGAEQNSIRVLGFLYGGPSSAVTSLQKNAFTAALERGLNETGYIDGQNLRIEAGTSVKDLIRDNAEVIIVASGASIQQASKRYYQHPPFIHPVGRSGLRRAGCKPQSAWWQYDRSELVLGRASPEALAAPP